MQVATKYAKLLFDEASKAKATDKILGELNTFYEAIFLKAEVAKALASPAQKDKIEEMIGRISLKYKFSKLTSNFMQLIVRLKRVKFLPAMVREYKNLVDSAGGRKLVDVVSAKEMDKQDKAAIEKLLAPQFGDNILVKYSLDPAIIGGIVASCGSVVFDASVRGAVDRVLV